MNGNTGGGKVDLHLHSTASDGQLAPAAVVERAVHAGVVGLSLSDHDTVAGLDEAWEAARRFGVRLLSATELSARIDGYAPHLLAYGFDPDSKDLLGFMKECKDYRYGRAVEIVRLLNTVGVPLRMEQVEAAAGDAAVTRAHIGRELVRRGFVRRIGDAFDKWIGEGGPAYVDKAPIPPSDVFKAVHAAGGVVILAHPGTTYPVELIKEWIEQGLDGIEVMHPSNSPGVRRMALKLIEQHDLLPSGGSDWHGPEGHRPGPGTEKVPVEWLDQIEKRCEWKYATTN